MREEETSAYLFLGCHVYHQAGLPEASLPPPPASKPRSSIRAGASWKLPLKHDAIFGSALRPQKTQFLPIRKRLPLKRASEGASHTLQVKMHTLPWGPASSSKSSFFF
jgi:hypothetical protein